MRQNIVFSYSERIPVSLSWLFHYFSFFFCYFTLLLIFTKIIYYYYFIIYVVFFFHDNYFYFFMFRNVPGCSMFLVLSTPYRNAKKVVFCQLFLSCYVSLNWALFRYSSLNLKFIDWNDTSLKLYEVKLLNKCSKICVLLNLDSLECFWGPLINLLPGVR